MDLNDVINKYMSQKINLLTSVSKVLAWMRLCFWLILNQEKKK